MNKKFSTLVASLLLTSAFSVYSVDAKPMLATPTQVETRATLPAEVEEAVEATTAGVTLPDYSNAAFQATSPENGQNLLSKVLPGFTNNSRIFMVGQSGTTLPGNAEYFLKVSTPSSATTGNVTSMGGYSSSDVENYYWTLDNGQLINNARRVLTIDGVSDHLEVIPMLENGKATPYFVIGNRDSQGRIRFVKWNSSVSPARLEFTSAAADYSELDQATFFISVETAFLQYADGDDVNAVFGNGFNLSISSLKDADATITNAEAFNGLLTAMDNNTTAATSQTSYHLKNAADKYIVFDENAQITSDGYSQKGKFVLVDWADVASYNDYGKFYIKKADNGSELVQVSTGQWGGERLYIANVNDTYGLSIAKNWQPCPAENWAVTSLSDNTLIDPRTFLTGEFYTIDFVKSAATNDEYKDGGRLAVRENNKSDYVDAKGLYEKAPEAQWAVSAYRTNGSATGDIVGFTLTNRENLEATVTITALRSTPDGYEVVSILNTPSTNTGVAAGDIIKITAVKEHSQNDGYEVVSANDLRNETYRLGQVRQTADGDINVYWAENHGTHQIGATVEEANASRWNLGLANKFAADHTTETDSVLVISELQKWNDANSRIDVKKDTLVILPYVFQNRSNNEYVVMNDQQNLEYYICDKDNKTNAQYAQRFALKMKADGTYNYVALESYTEGGMLPLYQTNGAVWPKTTRIADNKVFQENSTDRGTWKDMPMYANDANSLMFVTKVDAPEYRKLVTGAALDTIKLYRADNEAQVVYEKADVSLAGRTLSFLNIDNDNQFTEINPALYADTAYVNRGNNTRWQYLLGVNIEHKEGYYCPEHGFGETEPCQHAEWVSYNEGRYLINMIDTANVYGANVNIHNNPYINENEEDALCAKLSFVDAIHVLTDNVDPTKADKLYVINGAESRDKYTVIDLSTADFNVAKFAFKYTDSMESDNFKIQTLWKEYLAPEMPNATDAQFRKAYADNASLSTEEGYLRWVNGCIVVDKGYQMGDVFNMDENETRTPTANEAIEDATSAISVVATEGGVIVKGAEGKNVIVSTILGKVVANETVTSDNVTIAAPAGIVVVSVDGESFKVAVK